ncbi:MAG: cobalt-precorrin-5B (C(1))-methyltransferase [bacterium]|nr:cobalt-precorrin-5B (C(1))-methyltransferase [bacterium]
MTNKPKKKKRGDRTGFTTGACSAAAAKAATQGLVTREIPDHIECKLPNGQLVKFEVIEARLNDNYAHAVVIKDAGDDPDCTDKAHLTADVCLLPDASGKVLLKGGDGVGTVTLTGLGLEVGGPAINPVPRQNIEENVRAAGDKLLQEQGLEVTISVPGGEKMATHSINARLGILGGISILGTTGIVRPYSTVAFRASVIQGIEVAKANGQDTIVLTTGGRTEKFVIKQLSHLPPVCFVQMGDFLRYALDTSVKVGIKHVIIGGMIGKLTKIAQGETITHAGRSKVNTQMLAEIAVELGVAEDVCNEIATAITARFAIERLEPLGMDIAFQQAVAEKVIDTVTGRYRDKFTLRVLVSDFKGTQVAEARSQEGNQ